MIHSAETGNRDVIGGLWGALLVVAGLFLQPVLWFGLSFYTDAWWGLALQLFEVLILLGAAALNYWARNIWGFFMCRAAKCKKATN